METKTTGLTRAMAVAKAKETQALQNKVDPDKKSRYHFRSLEFDAITAKLLNNDTALDPHAEIKLFNQVAKDRGYDFFSPESMKDWMQKYGSISDKDIVDKATEDTKQFMYSIQTPGHPEHEQNRLLFANFKGDEKAVTAFFYENRQEEAGRNFRPMKDMSYEQRMLTYKRVITDHQAFEHRTLCDLLKAKWSSIGYYKDEEYKARFIDEYCVAIVK